jgi:hypothetical protein
MNDDARNPEREDKGMCKEKKQLLLLKEILVSNCRSDMKQVTISKKQFLNVSASGTHSYCCPVMFQ